MSASLANLVKVTGSTTTGVTTAGVTTTTGSTFFISVSEASSHTFNTPPTDSKSNTYSQLGTTQASGGDALSIWKVENGTGGASHTASVAWASAADPVVFFGEVAGVLAASIDTGSRVQGSDAASPFTVTSGTLAQADELVICFISTDSGSNPATLAESSGFTIAGKEENAALFWEQGVGTKSVLATTALTPSWTATGGANANLHIVGFKSAAASGITGAGQIASGEAIGQPGIGAGIAPAGVVSAEAFGSDTVAAAISTAGIASAEALGQPSVSASISATGVASGETIGQPAAAAAINATGIASAEAVGQPIVNPIIAVGIASAEALGQPAIGAGISATGVASAETFGSDVVGAAIAAVGVASGEAFGLPVVNPAGIVAVGISSAEAFGQPAISAEIDPAGVVSGEVFGLPLVGMAAPASAAGGGYKPKQTPKQKRAILAAVRAANMAEIVAQVAKAQPKPVQVAAPVELVSYEDDEDELLMLLA